MRCFTFIKQYSAMAILRLQNIVYGWIFISCFLRVYVALAVVFWWTEKNVGTLTRKLWSIAARGRAKAWRPMAPIFTRVELLVFALVWLTRLYCGGACSSAQYEESQKKHKNNDLAVITKEYDYVFWLCSAKTDQALFPRAWYPVSRGKKQIFRSRDWSNPQRD